MQGCPGLREEGCEDYFLSNEIQVERFYLTRMTLFQFNALDETEQYEAIWNHGVMVGDRIEGEHKIILYQIFSFYVELYYHVEFNVLRRLRSFSSTKPLEQYLNQINIDSLID